MRKNSFFQIIGCLCLAIALFSCQMQDRYKTELAKHMEAEVNSGEAEYVHVELNGSVGKLYVHSTSESLMDGDFYFYPNRLQPDIHYHLKDGVGYLTIGNEDGHSISMGKFYNEWDIRLGTDIPKEVEINFGVGETEVALGNCQIEDLDINIGIGESVIDLRGEWPEKSSVTIDGGIGETNVWLPCNVGIRVVASKGIGELSVAGLLKDNDVWKTPNFDEAESKMYVEINQGIGEINIACQEEEE